MSIFKRLKKYDPEKEKALREQIELEGGLEKNDTLAMFISAFLVLFLPFAIIVAILFFLFF